MTMLVPFIIMSFATMRLSRLVVKDDIFREWRQKLVYWLANGKAYFDDDNVLQHTSRRLPKWRDKLVKLATCPYCVSVWLAGFMTIAWHFVVDPLPAPVFVWLAVCAGSLVVWEYVDGD
jgi:hypothetical protein